MRAARLGDVVASMKNGIYKPASEYADDGMPCLRMYNIDAGSIVWRDIKRMRINDREFADYGLHEGDLLVNRVNSRELVGKAAYIPASLEPSVFESKNIRLRLDRAKALPKFIDYQLFARGSRHFANNAQQVVGMASISQGQLADFPIVLTGLDEQCRIVAEIEKQFSRLDEAVANLRRVKANLKRYRAAVLNAAAQGRLVPTEAEQARRAGRGYESAAVLFAKILAVRRQKWDGRGSYKEPSVPDGSQLSALPEEWVWMSVGQAASGERHALAIGPFGSSLKVSDYVTDGVPLVFVRNIRAMNFGHDNSVFVSPEKAAELHAHWVAGGDLLITKMGAPPGDVCIYPDHRPVAVITADCIKLRPSPALLNGKYLAAAIAASPSSAKSRPRSRPT